MPGVQVPMVIQPTPQAITIGFDELENGTKLAHVMVSMPMATFIIDLDEPAARNVIGGLEQLFGKPTGLHIATEMPDGPNGTRPT